MLESTHFPGVRSGTANLRLLALLFCVAFCHAQDQPTAPGADSTNPRVVDKNIALIPAGTRIPLVLTHPVQSRYVHRGDGIYARITAPVTSGDEALIPPGTFLQGKADRLELRRERAQLYLQSASLTFPNGYVVQTSAPLTLESYDGYAVRDPGRGRIVSAFLIPLAGGGLGALIGHAAGGQGTNINGVTFPGGPPSNLSAGGGLNPGGLRATAIGGMAGMAGGGIASLLLVFGTHNFVLDLGTPVEMVLPLPLFLERDHL